MINTLLEFLYHCWLILSLVGMSLASWGIGAFLSDQLIPNGKARQNLSLVFPFLLGQVCFSTAFIAVTLFFPSPINAILLLPVFLLGLIRAIQQLQAFTKSAPLLLKTYSFDLDTLIPTLLLIAVLFFHFSYSFHRPSEWDEVAYHFPAVQELAAGRIHFPLLQHHPYTSFYQPFSDFYGSLAYGSESYVALSYLLSFQHPATAHLVYFINFVAFLVLVSYVLRELFSVDTFTNRIISLLLATNPAIVSLLTTGTIDLQVMIFQFAAFSTIILSKHKKIPQLLLISSILMGFAIGQKFTSIFLIPLYLPLFLYCAWPKSKNLRWLIGAGALMVASGGIWYGINVLLHFNPIYPLYFGHRGMSDQSYHFLMETLINSLRSPITLKNIWLNIKSNYGQDTSTILAAVIVCLAVVLRKLRPSFANLTLALTLFFFYTVNFVVGSQLSRYILLCPIILHLFLAQAINKQKLLAVFLVVIALANIRLNPNQWIIWKSRLNDLPNAFEIQFSRSDAHRLGCVANVFAFVQQQQSPVQVLNLWDAYAGSYYATSQVFYHIPQDFSATDLKLPAQVKFVYVNSQIKKEIIASSGAHADMRPDQRASAEAQLIGKKLPVFEDGTCAIYPLQ